MNSHPRDTTLVLGMLIVVSYGMVRTEAGETESPTYFDETKAITLFAFDDVSIPFTRNLKLEMNAPQKHAANPVVRRGAAGSNDAWAVQFYGSVIRVEGKFRMWYVSVGDDRLDPKTPRSFAWRVAYAESEDGVNWKKPQLGLVEYNGSRKNNLVKLEPRLGVVNVKVLHDPDDSDPSRRYKMGAHVWFPKNKRRLGTIAPYVSGDGLNWKLLIDAKPVDAELPADKTVVPPLHIEPVGGLYKWDGLFHLSGQNAVVASRPYQGRVPRTFVSPDFARWSQGSAIQYVRTPQHHVLGPGTSRIGEQTHEGVSVWNRRNVLVGIGGMWHGTPEWKDLTIDLGLLVSNNGIHFREPAHEHIFLSRGKDGEWDQGGLLQGQGFENVGEQTYIYYGAWDPRGWEKSPRRGGVGIATLPRDRFAHFVVDKRTEGRGDYQMPKTVSSFMTGSIELKGDAPRRFFVNAEGLGENANLKVELLAHNTVPLTKHSEKNAAIVRTGGFQTPVTWDGDRDVRDLPERVRVRVTFEGRNKSNIRFNALYIR